MKSKKIKLLIVLTVISLTGFTLSNELFSNNQTKAKTKPISSEISDNKERKATVYTSSAASAGRNKLGKAFVSTSFIEDPSNSNLTALITIKGFIPSGLTRKGEYLWGKMNWPRKYSITTEISDTNDEVKILESIPNNTIDTVNVSESIGYSIGGNLSITPGSGSTGGDTGFNLSRSISYEQPDFRTIQTSDGIKKSSWDIEFVATKDGYDLNSYHGIYGNQMFMKARLHNSGFNNLLEDENLSQLISGGFSPNIVLAVKAPKDITSNTTLKLSYSKYMDLYSLDWYYGSGWYGKNESSDSPQTEEHTFTIDWKNHAVKNSSL